MHNRSIERRQNRRIIGMAAAGWLAFLGIGGLASTLFDSDEPMTNLEFAVTCPDGSLPFVSDGSTVIDDIGTHAVRVSCFDSIEGITAPDTITEVDSLFIPESPESAYLEVTTVPCVDNGVFPAEGCAAALPLPAAGIIRQGVEDTVIPIYSAERIVDTRLVLQPENS